MPQWGLTESLAARLAVEGIHTEPLLVSKTAAPEVQMSSLNVQVNIRERAVRVSTYAPRVRRGPSQLGGVHAPHGCESGSLRDASSRSQVGSTAWSRGHQNVSSAISGLKLSSSAGAQQTKNDHPDPDSDARGGGRRSLTLWRIIPETMAVWFLSGRCQGRKEGRSETPEADCLSSVRSSRWRTFS